MDSLVLIIFSILFYVTWFVLSITATVYWFKTPKNLIKNSQEFDFTKRAFWYYGFAFLTFITCVIIASGVVILAIILKDALGV